MTRFQELLVELQQAKGELQRLEGVMGKEFDTVWVGLKSQEGARKCLAISSFSTTVHCFPDKDNGLQIHACFGHSSSSCVHIAFFGMHFDVKIDEGVLRNNCGSLLFEARVCSTRQAIDDWLAETS